ncbi:Deleted in malignant brain tumors 1 protein [Bulinus truncatus]|nr:Deleted in malignant brain tumors 1 protein [Bulinus truncatus]
MKLSMDVNGNCLILNVMAAFFLKYKYPIFKVNLFVGFFSIVSTSTRTPNSTRVENSGKEMEEIVGVMCSNSLYLETQGRNVRLVNGNFNYQGTVEVFYNNSWGAVCDDHWSTSAAQVVCSMLGHRRDGAVAVSSNGFNAAQHSPFWLDDVNCTGTETNVFDCTHRQLGGHNCGLHELAGVKCIPEKFDKYKRLVHGGENYQGTVEVFYNNRWGTVCDDYWSDNAAQVVCSMLGYVRSGAVPVSGNGFKSIQYNDFWLDHIKCSGNETSLFDCPHLPWGEHHCGSSEQAGVRCTPVCQSSFWKCTNGQCVTNSSLCDGVQDCTDNSDELNCGNLPFY